jgi:hypothetical protein
MPEGAVQERVLPQGTPRPAASPAVPASPGPLSPGPLSPGSLQPGSLRASDADRNEIVGALREEYAAGRLSHDTFLFRMHAAMDARHVADLPPLLADLPPAPPPRPGVLGRVRGVVRRLTGHGRAPGGGPAPGAPAGQPLATRVPAGGAFDGAPHGQSQDGDASVSAVRRLTSALRLPAAGSPQPAAGPPQPLPFPRTPQGFFTIGRDSRCDLAIDDMTVSRIHARLEQTPNGWLLKDLSSTNGTRLNGWRVRGQVGVRARDVVCFGDVAYVLIEE